MEVFVGIQTQEEQALDSAAFQRLVRLEGFIDLRQALAQVRQIKTLTDIMEGGVADAVAPMDQMLPAPALGLLGKIQITARAEDRSQKQAQKEAAGRNRGIGAAAAHGAHHAAEGENLGQVAQKLGHFVHPAAATSGSPRRSSSRFIWLI